jgi:flagellar biosynthesis protein FlhG
MDRYSPAQAARMLGISEERLQAAVATHGGGLPGQLSPDGSLDAVQVETLRRVVRTPQQAGGAATASPPSEPPSAAPPRDGLATVFAVTSGKGGVGKTSCSVNICTEFARRGYRTVLVDADLGLANTHILAGVKIENTLSQYLDGSATLDECVVQGPKGLQLVSGGSGLKEMADLDATGRKAILGAIQELRKRADVVLIDTSAGISRSVTDFVSVSDHTVIVTTSNFAAIADAYGMIKVLAQEGYDKLVHLVINRVRSPEEAEQVYKKLKGCTDRFLSFDLNWLGLVPEDSAVEGAVLKRSPFCESFPMSVATRYVKKLVNALERYVAASSTR